MTAGGLDVAAVQARLRALEELLGDLDAFGPLDAPRLREDRVLQRAVERVLAQLVERAVAVNVQLGRELLGEEPDGYTVSFAFAERAGALPAALARELEPSVGVRDLLVHGAVSLELLARAAPRVGAGYRAYVKAMRRYLSRPR